VLTISQLDIETKKIYYISFEVSGRLCELGNHGILAASMSTEDVNENNPLKEAYAFVFVSPKSFLQNEK